MPLTFPSHAAVCLPLKMKAPQRWDGVALVIGSTAPDLTFAPEPYFQLQVHGLAALFWFCLPATLIGTWVVRRTVPTIAAHLPNFGQFALRDFGVLGRNNLHPWAVTCWSALAGIASHLLWDSFTHSKAERIWPQLGLGHQPIPGYPWWNLLQLTSSAIGALVSVALVWQLGRRRQLRAWYGPPPAVPVRPKLFWAAVVLVGGAGLATVPLLKGWANVAISGVRLLELGAVALLAGAAAVLTVTRPKQPALPQSEALTS